jgi:hypothetical protein
MYPALDLRQVYVDKSPFWVANWNRDHEGH